MSGRDTFYLRYGKRAFDISLSLFALILLAPLLALLWVCGTIVIGHPVGFRQKRSGLRERLFEIRKFRTMTDQKGTDGSLLSDGERLNPYGRFLRASSLDELPELWNVLVGDMSFVGPRPLLARYVDRYSRQERRRHEVRPGITGWAQVHGRNSVSWTEKFDFDIWYVDHVSFGLDMRILCLTVVMVLSRTGIKSDDSATATEFLGSGE